MTETTKKYPRADEFGVTIKRNRQGKLSSYLVGISEGKVLFFEELTSNRVLSAALREAATGLDRISQGLSRGVFTFKNKDEEV